MLFIVLRVRVCVPGRFSHVRLFAVSGAIASQTPLSMEFSRQEYWSGLLCPLPGDLPDPRIEPVSPAAPALSGAKLPAKGISYFPNLAGSFCHACFFVS